MTQGQGGGVMSGECSFRIHLHPSTFILQISVLIHHPAACGNAILFEALVGPGGLAALGPFLEDLAVKGRRVEKLDGLLHEADLVKFAKHIPETDAGVAAMSTAREIVVKTTPRTIVPEDPGPAGPPGGDVGRHVSGSVEAG